jgi:hypothetical protein
VIFVHAAGVGRAAQAVDPEGARDAARDILNDRRFRREPAPRPFRGPLRWLGDRLQPVTDWIGRVFGAVPGWVWLGLAIVVVAAVVARIIVVSRRRRVGSDRYGRVSGGLDAEREDPDALDRAADDAERRGDLKRAVRLRFRAGLLRLGDRGAIAYRPSVTTGEVRQVLGSATFEELARTFEGVAYGGRPAGPSDLDAARQGWPRVLDDAGHR